MSARIGSAAPPGAMISSQSIRLRNCRTLPGQSYACSAASVSADSSRGCIPAFSAERTMNSCASGGTSSRRSFSAGTFSGTTASR